MQKILAFDSIGEGINQAFIVSDLLDLGHCLQVEIPTADTLISGDLKEKLQKLMYFNIIPFEKALSRFPDVIRQCGAIRDLFGKESVTYRDTINAILLLVDTAETLLMSENSSLKNHGFYAIKTHAERVENICHQFPKICLLPLYGPKGLFSLDLILQTMLEAKTENGQLSEVIWPFSICPEWADADGRSVGPAAVGRHDRVHLQIFESVLFRHTTDEGKAYYKEYLPFEIVQKGIWKMLSQNLDKEERKYLDMINFYGLHEDLNDFLQILDDRNKVDNSRNFLKRVSTLFLKDSEIPETLLKVFLKLRSQMPSTDT